MFTQNLLEEAKLDAMQRHWQNRRGTLSSTSFFEEVNEIEDFLVPFQVNYVLHRYISNCR